MSVSRWKVENQPNTSLSYGSVKTKSLKWCLTPTDSPWSTRYHEVKVSQRGEVDETMSAALQVAEHRLYLATKIEQDTEQSGTSGLLIGTPHMGLLNWMESG